MEWGIGVLLAAAFAGYRLWQALTGMPLVWQDSSGYQHSSIPLAAKTVTVKANDALDTQVWLKAIIDSKRNGRSAR